MDDNALTWILSLKVGTGKLELCLIRLLEFEFDVTLRSGINKYTAHVLSQLQTGRKHTIELDHDLPDVRVSLVKQGGEKINDNHDRNYDLLCTCQQCDDMY